MSYILAAILFFAAALSVINDIKSKNGYAMDARLDLSASYDINSAFSVTLYGQNLWALNNAKIYYYSAGLSSTFPDTIWTEEPSIIGLSASYKFF